MTTKTELIETFQGCETALNIITDQIADLIGEATWYPWTSRDPATPESVAAETLAALVAAEESGASIGLEIRALVRVLTREGIAPPDGLEDIAGSDTLLAEGEILEDRTENEGDISPVSHYAHRAARVRVGRVVFGIEVSWATGSWVVGDERIIRESP